MFRLSELALKKKLQRKKVKEIIIGYFSGRSTHNDDIEMIVPALIKILQEFKNVKLLFLGEIEISDKLKNFFPKIIKKPFVKWNKLPELISKVDINVVPIRENIFNKVKSEKNG